MTKIQKPVFYKSETDLPRGIKKVDAMESATRELFFIENPTIRKDNPNLKNLQEKYISEKNIEGVWVYYPWHKIAVHIPPEDIYFRLRTARNRDLITEKEQRVYRNAVVGIAGLSVGSSILSTVVMTGGPKTIKIADPDFIEITNLNRIRAKLTDVLENKTHVAAREVWELDPFADLHMWDKGIQKDELETFVSGKPKLDVFIDEMDNIEMKIRSRLVCRELGVPVVMATDNGDGLILDVERHDLEKKYPIFHGNIEEKELKSSDPGQFIKMAVRIIDPAYFTERQQQSILQIGKTLPSVAQLGTAATVAGAAVAYAVRRIANKEHLPSGRYVVGFEGSVIKDYWSTEKKEKRWKKTVEFSKIFGITPQKPPFNA